jgi:hypothetical protein
MTDNVRRLCAAALMLAALTTPAKSQELPSGYSCSDIRSFVERYGYWTALAHAVAHGATRSQLKAAKRCLDGRA